MTAPAHAGSNASPTSPPRPSPSCMDQCWAYTRGCSLRACGGGEVIALGPGGPCRSVFLLHRGIRTTPRGSSGRPQTRARSGARRHRTRPCRPGPVGGDRAHNASVEKAEQGNRDVRAKKSRSHERWSSRPCDPVDGRRQSPSSAEASPRLELPSRNPMPATSSACGPV